MNKGYHRRRHSRTAYKNSTRQEYVTSVLSQRTRWQGNGEASAIATADVLNKLHPASSHSVADNFPESQLYQEVQDGTYIEEPEIERLMEMRTLIDKLNIRVNLLGHHISNTVPITGALPDDKAAILREFDKAIAQFPEKELKAYRSRIWHL